MQVIEQTTVGDCANYSSTRKSSIIVLMDPVFIRRKINTGNLTSNNSTMTDSFLFLWISQAILAAVPGSKSSSGAFR